MKKAIQWHLLHPGAAQGDLSQGVLNPQGVINQEVLILEASLILKVAIPGLVETHGPGPVEGQVGAGCQYPYHGMLEEAMDLVPFISYLAPYGPY